MSNIPLHHLLPPPQNFYGELPPCLSLMRKSWGSTRGKDRTWMQWRVHLYFQFETRAATRLFGHQMFSLPTERTQVFRKMYAKPTHTHRREPPMNYPCRLRNQPRPLLAHHVVLFFTDGRSSCGRIIWATKLMQHNWGTIMCSTGQHWL